MSRVLLSPRWLGLHVLAVVLSVSCVALGTWQLQRAEEGNGRSLGYAVQWPFFAVFVLVVWAWLAREALRGGDASSQRVRPTTSTPAGPSPAGPARTGPGGCPRDDAHPDEDEDPELAAYNRMLAELHRQDTIRQDAAGQDAAGGDRDRAGRLPRARHGEPR